MKTLSAILLLLAAQDQTGTSSQSENWVVKALVGAILAVAGYFGKSLHDQIKAKTRAKRNSKSEMIKLSALLQESGSLFRDQNYKARRLMKRSTVCTHTLNQRNANYTP